MDFKEKWVNTLHANRQMPTLVLHTMDQIMDATVHIEDSIADTMEGSMLDPQERNSYRMKLSIPDMLGKLNPSNHGPVFTPVELMQPNLLHLLQDIQSRSRTG